jgi:hypothetical protein
MFVDAEYTISIKISNFLAHSNLTEDDLKKVLMQEGDDRVKSFLLGYLFDPDKKIIKKEINNIKIK